MRWFRLWATSIRRQPGMLRGNPQPLTYTGEFVLDGEKIPYKVLWAGLNAGSYLHIPRLPGDLVTSPMGELGLLRTSSQCQLIINKIHYPCASLRFWSDFELGGSVEKIIQNLNALGIARSGETGFRTLNAKDFEDKNFKFESKMKPALKNLQGSFVSVLDFLGGNNTEIAFDSLTYAPLYAKIPVEGMTWELIGNPNLYLEREENKNNLVISRGIEIREGSRVIGQDRREPLRRIAKPTIPSFAAKAGGAQIPFDRFTDKGKTFLQVLFLTH